VLSDQAPEAAQMYGVGSSVPVDNSLASFVLANHEVLSRAILQQRSNLAALLTIMASVQEHKVTGTSVMAYDVGCGVPYNILSVHHEWQINEY